MFDWFRKKSRPEAPPVDQEPLGPGPGWQAIEDAWGRVYPGQRARYWTHEGVMRMHDLREPPENPLDGVNIYDGGDFWHYVSLGLSDLYERVSEDEWSGFGYELTFRVEKTPQVAEPMLWPIAVMRSLARAAFSGSDFASGDTVQTGSLDGRSETRLTALLITDEPASGSEPLETPTGKLRFLLLLGVPAEVREQALSHGSAKVLQELRSRDERLVTRLR